MLLAGSSHSAHSYKLTLFTGDRPHAGTSANVYCEIVGENGTTSKVPLENHRKNFQRARTDVFDIETDDLGKLKHIVIGHDNQGLVRCPHANWFDFSGSRDVV